MLFKSDRRGSNPRPRPWQGRTLPTEPLSHSLYCSVCFLCSLEQYILYRIIRLLSTAFFNFFSKFLMQYILFHFFAHFSYMKVSNLLSFNKTNLGKSVVFYFFCCYDKQNDDSRMPRHYCCEVGVISQLIYIIHIGGLLCQRQLQKEIQLQKKI